MRVLLITSEEWNDYTFPNGVLTNWFTDFDVEVAQIYTSPGKPVNDICDKYFQITDAQMAKSIFGGRKAGAVIYKPSASAEVEAAKENAQRKGVYGFMKNLSLYWRTPVMMIRDFIWTFGRCNKEALRTFVDEFNPDVVFCPRYISIKLMKLEKIVSKMTNAPFVAFTADDEASLDNLRWTELEYYRRLYIHSAFVKHSKLYSCYLMHSADQADEYRKEYNLKTSTIFKCGTFADRFTPKVIGNPIRMIYAGRLYCNRWKSLAAIGEALRVINKDGVKMILDVYTQDVLTKEQKQSLSADKFIYIRGSVTSAELKDVYAKAEIALHVESFDDLYKNVTRVSFSTKVIDLLASSCAVLAICWERHAAYQYLKENDAAFCCNSYESILPVLTSIVDNPKLIQEYQEKAFNCGLTNHTRKIVQDKFLKIFKDSIQNGK